MKRLGVAFISMSLALFLTGGIPALTAFVILVLIVVAVGLFSSWLTDFLL